MKVRVQIFGALQKPEGQGDFTRELKDGTTVEALLLALEYHPRHVAAIIAELNGKQVKHSVKLKDNDVVGLSLAIGGG